MEIFYEFSGAESRPIFIYLFADSYISFMSLRTHKVNFSCLPELKQLLNNLYKVFMKSIQTVSKVLGNLLIFKNFVQNIFFS